MTPTDSARNHRLRGNLVLLKLFTILLATLLSSCTRPYPWPGDRSIRPVEWRVEYMGYACGDFSAQLRPIAGLAPDFTLDGFRGGLVIYVPPHLDSPDQIDELRVPGNFFKIRGFSYSHLDPETGLRIVNPRFDLLSWSTEEPLSIFRDDAVTPAGPTDSFHAESSAVALDPSEFQAAGKYSGC